MGYPDAIIVAIGSTDVRTRLYRMGISKHLKEIKLYFAVFGLTELGEWESFKIGKDYEAFFVTKKENS